MDKKEYKRREELVHALTYLIIGVTILLITFTSHFVIKTTHTTLDEWNYSQNEKFGALAFSAVTGAIISMFLKTKHWWGCAHFSALSYVTALLFSIPTLRTAAPEIQAISAMSFVMLGCCTIALCIYSNKEPGHYL